MITIKQESVLIKKIKSLTELEFDSLMDEVAQHVYANKWHHVVKANFADPYQEEEIENLQEELDEMTKEKDNGIDYMWEAVEILQNIETLEDDVQKAIDKAIKILS